MPLKEKLALLKDWFELSQRPFPWRRMSFNTPRFPYAVWVSEVMLQQTRAEVVVPFFSSWMQRFPSIEALAGAKETDVLKAWEGLGYYSRAKRLWLGAQHLVSHHGGKLPSSYDELLKIPGFGPYTAGAVASFAFHKKAAAVDGNVSRVLTRLFAIEDPIDSSTTQKHLRTLALQILPEEKPWIIAEALIELGAVICTRRPHCKACPLQEVCLARRNNTTEKFPYKKRKEAIEKIYRNVAIVICNEKILVNQVGPGKVMAGLYEFPYFEKNEEAFSEQLKSLNIEEFSLLSTLDQVRHSFTRYLAHLFPFVIECKQEIEVKGYQWFPLKDLSKLPFSSGHRKILEQLSKSPSMFMDVISHHHIKACAPK